MTVDRLFSEHRNVALARALALLAFRRGLYVGGKRVGPVMPRYESAAAYAVVLRRSVDPLLRQTVAELRDEARREFEARADTHQTRVAGAAARLWKLCDEVLAVDHAQPLGDDIVSALMYCYAGMDEDFDVADASKRLKKQRIDRLTSRAVSDAEKREIRTLFDRLIATPGAKKTQVLDDIAASTGRTARTIGKHLPKLPRGRPRKK